MLKVLIAHDGSESAGQFDSGLRGSTWDRSDHYRQLRAGRRAPYHAGLGLDLRGPSCPVRRADRPYSQRKEVER
jgi:hypothetical protein